MNISINYKDIITTITCIELYAKDNILNVCFDDNCKNEYDFFINYLEVNRVEYEIEFNTTSFIAIIIDLNLFALGISIKYPVKSSNICDNFLKAVLNHKHKIKYLEDSIDEYNKEYERLIAKLKNCDNEKKSELAQRLNKINIKQHECNMRNILASVELIQKELDEIKALVSNVKDLKIAFHLSEMLNEEMCRKVLYLQEYLMNKQKLTKDERKWLESLKKLSKYAYEEDVNEVKKILLVMTSEYFKNAAKYVENDKNVQLKIEEDLREFYR